MSIVLQATTGRVDESLTKNMLLPLAERMIAKMAKEKKMEQEQETHLYLMVLELQKKFQEALNILDGPVGKQLEDKTSYWELCNTKKIDYLKKLQKYRTSFFLYYNSTSRLRFFGDLHARGINYEEDLLAESADAAGSSDQCTRDGTEPDFGWISVFFLYFL